MFITIIIFIVPSVLFFGFLVVLVSSFQSIFAPFDGAPEPAPAALRWSAAPPPHPTALLALASPTRRSPIADCPTAVPSYRIARCPPADCRLCSLLLLSLLALDSERDAGRWKPEGRG